MLKEMIFDSLKDRGISTAVIFICYFIIELLTRKFGNKFTGMLKGRTGPLFGAIFGSIPQCSFSVISTIMYSKKAITLGTLFTVYLVTSDEAFIIMLSHPDKIFDLLIIFGTKIIIGLFVGYLIDFLLYKFNKKKQNFEDDSLNIDECNEKTNIFVEVICETIKVSFYLIISLLSIDLIIYYIGEENINNFLIDYSYLQFIISPLIGLIPSCVPSVILSELYIGGQITYSGIIGGLLTNAGLSLVFLFRYNKSLKNNILIVISLYSLGVIFGGIIHAIELLI